MTKSLFSKCSYLGCPDPVGPNKYACTDHWFTLPRKLRIRLAEGLNKRSPMSWMRANKEALDFWHGAKKK
jgi:hypothetical protein